MTGSTNGGTGGRLATFDPPGLSALTVRRCTPADASAVAELASRLFVQAYGPTHPEPELSRYLRRSFPPAWAARELAKITTAILAVEDLTGSLRAYAHLQLTTDSPPGGVRGQRPVEIARFYVDTAFHGRGVAQALMSACDAEASAWGADVVWLAVWQEAARPLAFYRKCGFEVVGQTTFRFGDRLDRDYVMAKPLARARPRK